MSFKPYLRVADDGTFELLVPSAGGTIYVLPYCFHTEEDAANWLSSRKGQEQIRKIRNRYERSKRRIHRHVLHTEAVAG
jgi:hypothetical protein